jgi:phospho-N-acetylmuramoyl-pentapeptide-transferase
MTDAGVFLAAALATLLLGKPVIGWLAGIRARQTIYAYAPETHRAKEGTPTMGGLLLMLGVVVGLTVWGWQTRETLVPMLVIFAGAVWFAFIGLLDDYWIRRWTGQRGLEWKQKLALQLVAAGLSVYVLWLVASGAEAAESLLGLASEDTAQLPLNLLTFGLGVLWVVGWVNAFNLTDGLDGLAAGLTALAMMGVYAIGAGQGGWMSYALMVAGACVGYLWWNVHPARVFMGDTGSMFLGASFGLLTLRYLLTAPEWQVWGRVRAGGGRICSGNTQRCGATKFGQVARWQAHLSGDANPSPLRAVGLGGADDCDALLAGGRNCRSVRRLCKSMVSKQ